MGSPIAVQGAQNIPARRALSPLVPWLTVGLVGSIGLAVTGTSVGSVTEPNHALWWFSIPNGQSVLVTTLFYLSVALLIVGWLGVGRLARQGLLTTRWAWLILIAWGVPLFLGPPLFSRDIYSYIGQGLLAHHGLNPYSVPPKALGHGPLLSSIASVWRSTRLALRPAVRGGGQRRSRRGRELVGGAGAGLSGTRAGGRGSDHGLIATTGPSSGHGPRHRPLAGRPQPAGLVQLHSVGAQRRAHDGSAPGRRHLGGRGPPGLGRSPVCVGGDGEAARGRRHRLLSRRPIPDGSGHQALARPGRGRPRPRGRPGRRHRHRRAGLDVAGTRARCTFPPS